MKCSNLVSTRSQSAENAKVQLKPRDQRSLGQARGLQMSCFNCWPPQLMRTGHVTQYVTGRPPAVSQMTGLLQGARPAKTILHDEA